MTKRVALATVAAATLLIGIAYASAFLPGGAPAWAAWLCMLGTAFAMVAAMVMGAHSARRPLGALVWPFAFTLVVLIAGFSAALLLPEPTATSPLWLGLPPGAAVIMYGVGLLPLLVLPLAYALTFDARTLTPADIARITALAAELRATGGGGDRGPSDQPRADRAHAERTPPPLVAAEPAAHVTPRPGAA